MDWFAITSHGIYPTPTPTDAERAAYIVTDGLWGGPLSSSVAVVEEDAWAGLLRWAKKTWGYLAWGQNPWG